MSTPRASGTSSGHPTSAPKFPPNQAIPRKAAPNRLPLLLGASAAAFGAYYYFTLNSKSVPPPATTVGEKAAQYTNGVLNPTAEETLGKIGAKVDTVVDEGKHRITTAQQKLETKAEHLKHKTDEFKQPVLETIDNADRRIEKEAAKVTSGVGSWFGYGSK